ncbi:MAG TPA: NTP transferase domain-containing protein [Devosia sp.]
MSFHALIIAGGQGRRLGGVRKADIRIGGKRLIERVAERLEGAAHTRQVATGPVQDEWLLPQGWAQVSDLAERPGGPLAGLVAAVAALQEQGVREGILVTAAVDTPFLPQDYVTRLVEALGGAPVAFGAWGHSFYPPNAAWRLETIAHLPEKIAEVESLRMLQTMLGGKRVAWDESADNPFDNINTPEDLEAMEQRARRLAGL